MSDYIWTFDDAKCKIKGIFSAFGDNDAVNKEESPPWPVPSWFVVEIIGIIWIDENDNWQWKMRLKFPSGNKQAFSGAKGKQSNVEECLLAAKKFPMKDFYWFPNEKEDFQGLVTVMMENGLIESYESRKINEEISSN